MEDGAETLGIASEGIGETQSMTPVTETEPTILRQRDALTRAIDAARREGRDLDAEALGELFSRLKG